MHHPELYGLNVAESRERNYEVHTLQEASLLDAL